MRLLLRIYSILFETILSLFLTGVGIVAFLGGRNNLKMDMLPWKGAALTYGVLGLGMGGLILSALAAAGKLKILFPIWCAVIFVLLFHGFFLSSFMYNGPAEFRGAVWLTVGALGAFLSSWTLLQGPSRARL
jgi:hypothetical protein